MQTDPTNTAADTTALVIDEVELERLERDLADAADTLESIERITASGASGAETASAIRQLLDDGRFDLTAGSDDGSDLVGDGDVDTVQEIDAVAEVPLAATELDPAGTEVGHALEGGTESPLHLVDEAAVGHDDHVEVDIAAFLAEPDDDLAEG